MDVDLTLLRYHVLRDDVQVSKRLVHERRDIICPLQNLGIHIGIYEIQQLIENFLYIRYLIQISHDQRMFREEFLFFFLKPLLELILDLLLFVLQFFLQIKEPFIDIFHLLEFQPLELLLDLF